jgi:ATP-dependent Lon protease
MKESARAAISHVRTVADKYGIDHDFYKTKDIHIHFPEGAVPKDGPSAGITIATALLSQLTGRPVRCDVAMTGEITLRGRVLPIGGLKEKTVAAYRSKIQTVIIPEDNSPDLEEIDKTVRESLEFVAVKTVDAVFERALVSPKLPAQTEIPKRRAKKDELTEEREDLMPLIKPARPPAVIKLRK